MPLTSAYTTCEAFGWETGVDWNWREAPAFYGLLAFFIGFAALFVMIPGLPLIQVMFLAQVLNALLLPFILVFVMRLATDRTLMGPLASGRLLGSIGWIATAVLIGLSLILVVTSVGGPDARLRGRPRAASAQRPERRTRADSPGRPRSGRRRRPR